MNNKHNKVKESRINQIQQYLKDIEDTAINMEKSDYQEVRSLQLESIQYRLKKIQGLIGEN